MRASAPPLRPLEIAALALGSAAIAAVMHWPLPLHLGRDVSRDVGDPLVQAWQVAWGGHALLHQPLDYFQANTFWPLRNTLAFSEALVGYAPAGVVGDGVYAAIVRYNLLFLFAYALAFVGAYLLARELGVGRGAAAVGGAAFAYAPWRLEQDGHLHVLSSGGIPLCLFLLVRGYRANSAWTVLGAWLVATWQLSLGFTLGLQLAYLLAALALVAVVFWVRSRPPLGRATLVATLAGVTLFAGTAVLLARPYMQVLDDHPEAHRTRAQIAGLSPPLRAFIAAPEENLVWGKATAGVRDDLSSVPEQTLFPGVVIVSLALAGALGGIYAKRLRGALALAVLVFAVLSLGAPEHGSPFLHPYRLLYDFAPGWKGIRAPGRLTTLTSLALALLAAAGAQRGLHYAEGRSGLRFLRVVPSGAIGALFVIAILAEGSGFDLGGGGRSVSGPSHPAVPKPPPGQLGLPSPQLHLPMTIPANRRYVLWSTEGFPKIVNGRGSFVPKSFAQLTGQMVRFPDAATLARLRAIHVQLVVLHPNLARGTPWEGTELRRARAPGLRQSARDGVIVYELSSR